MVDCFYCGLPVGEANGKSFAREYGIGRAVARYLRCTAEHPIGRQDRGANIRENIVAACWWCNHQRHHGGGKAPDPKLADNDPRTGWRGQVALSCGRSKEASWSTPPALKSLWTHCGASDQSSAGNVCFRAGSRRRHSAAEEHICSTAPASLCFDRIASVRRLLSTSEIPTRSHLSQFANVPLQPLGVDFELRMAVRAAAG